MEQALRYNEGKPQWSQIHFESLIPMIRVLEYGAEKYFKFNWQNDMDRSKILESAMRHLAATFDGDLYDEESHQLHIAHVMANCMFWIYHFNKSVETSTPKEIFGVEEYYKGSRSFDKQGNYVPGMRSWEDYDSNLAKIRQKERSNETPMKKTWKELEYELLFGKKNETSGTNAQVQQPARSSDVISSEPNTFGGLDGEISAI